MLTFPPLLIAFDTPDSIRDALGRIRTRFGVPSGKVLPVGIGFIGWVLDKTEVSEDPRIPAALDELPKAIYFAFGEDLGKHVRQVRQYEAEREHKTLVFVCVSTVEEALKAANEWEVDVIVAQGESFYKCWKTSSTVLTRNYIYYVGVEAGGHSSMHAPPLSILLSAILEALPDGPPVVAAGGIATGAQVASLLTLGAAGVLLGTRLLFTEECQYTPFQKSAILDAGLDSSVHSGCFDEVMGFKWPPGIIGHAIKNDIYEDHLEGLSVEERKRRYDKGKQNGDEGRIITWGG